MLTLKHHGEFRVLMPNESHYKQYKEKEEKEWQGLNLKGRFASLFKKKT